MLQNHILLVISLLFGITMVTMLSNKLKISYPILLVISGLLISLVPGIPNISLQPELVFLIFLPPLLYSAAWNTSWNSFWKFRRPIALLSIGLVIFTSAAVAFISHAVIPGFSLAFGFLLGGIISPPDAIAATSILHNLKAPKRVVTILEGESLLNDASSLIVFRFALAAITTGQFTFLAATREFFIVALMGIAVGLLIGIIVYGIHRFFPTTPGIDTAITLITPYIMYIIAEHFHFSGVLAVVSGGLFLSSHAQKIFTSESRIQAISVWSTLTFLLNGVVFILIGLQLPFIIRGLEGYSLKQVIFYSIIISVLTIIIRLIWVFPSAYIPRWLFKTVRKNEANPGWKGVFLVGWSGMRGVVSLAAALAIPLTLSGQPFPHRNLILFITFVVIFVTLVLQGLSIGPLIRFLGLQVNEKESEETEALALRLRLAEKVLAHMSSKYAEEIAHNETYIRVWERYGRMIDVTRKKLKKERDEDGGPDFLPQYRQMLLELVEVRRKELIRLQHTKEFDEELIRKREWELDLEESRLRK